MPNSRTSRMATLVLCAGLVACASGWRLDAPATEPLTALPRVAPCRAIADAAISGPRGELNAVAYVSRSRTGQVRVHLGTESGLTILDAEVDGAAERVHAQSELGRLPGLLATVTGDLRRLLGDRSLFGIGVAPPETRHVSGDPGDRVAVALADGSWAVVTATDLHPGWTLLRVTLLDARRVPEAEIVYEDPGDEGLPRTLRLTDVTDHHTLSLDVQQVLAPEPPGGS